MTNLYAKLPTLQQLHMIREAGLKVALKDSPGDDNPLAGYCAAMTWTVYGCFGGEFIEGSVNGMAHYWNRLPNGEEVDLTSCQFGGDGLHPVVKGKLIPAPELADPDVLIFAARIKDALWE